MKNILQTIQNTCRMPARRGLLLCCGLAFMCASYAPTAYAFTQADLQAVRGGWQHYDSTEGACFQQAAATTPTGRFLPSGPGSTLDGHILPAMKGGTGLEERAVRSGNSAQLAPGTSNPGASLALAPNGLTDRDVEFYFNMRWRYAEWNWRGGSKTGPESVSWYIQAVRKVLVTNPETNISVVLSIVESGPAPWTGIQQPGELNEPDYWQGYIDGTPSEYRGRVSGLAPAASNVLGGGADIQRRILPNGSVEGPNLYYQWAPDQSVEAGTTYTGELPAGAATPQQIDGGAGTTCIGLSTGSDTFVFYSQYDPRWRGTCYGPGSPGGCQLSDIGEAGCGPSALAMVVATLVDSSVTPPDVAKYSYEQGWYHGSGTDWGLFNQGPKNWGLTSFNIGTDVDRAISALRSGALVVASGQGANPYTSFGHLLVIRGVTGDGKLLLGDSNVNMPPDEAPNNTREWEPSEIRQGLKNLWIITKDAVSI